MRIKQKKKYKADEAVVGVVVPLSLLFSIYFFSFFLLIFIYFSFPLPYGLLVCYGCCGSSLGFGWKPKGKDVELNKVNMKKIGQFSSGRWSYYAGTTLLRFLDMKMKIQLLVASYHLLQCETTQKESCFL